MGRDPGARPEVLVEVPSTQALTPGGSGNTPPCLPVPHLVIGQIQVIEVGQMLKRLLREPFKGQASVRALDEGDATGEHTSTNAPKATPLAGTGEGTSCGRYSSAPFTASPSRPAQPLAHRRPCSEEQEASTQG